MKFIPKTVKGKSPLEVAIDVRDNLIFIKKEYNEWVKNPIGPEPMNGYNWKKDEMLKAVINFINEESKKEIDKLLNI